MKCIKMVIDMDVIRRYSKFYFEQHPRAKKIPIKEPLHPSINTWAISKRMVANTLKQKWKDFIIWFVEMNGYSNLKLDNFSLTMKYYYKTKRRMDNDNRTPKMILDGLVESGMIIDDDYKHLNPLIIYGFYDKENPRTEIIIGLL